MGKVMFPIADGGVYASIFEGKVGEPFSFAL
jgi:hypothetical protein